MRYTVQDYGPQCFKEMVEKRLGKKLMEPRPYDLEKRSADTFGWTQAENGMWQCGLVIPHGRVKNDLRTALDKIASELKGVGSFRLTCNQGLLVSDIPDSKKAPVEGLLDTFKVTHDPFKDSSDLTGFSSDSDSDASWDSEPFKQEPMSKVAGA
jgi:sulfite reductase (NADPH) hemoprotein beta-component